MTTNEKPAEPATTNDDVPHDEKVTEPKMPVADGLMQSYGRAGYQGYAQSTGGKTFDGRDMPTWENLTDRIRQAWTDAATAILQKRLSPHATLIEPPTPRTPIVPPDPVGG